ncbi:MAG TPA: hypothetical protein VFM54_14720, partial [Micromonosporaceae bacterium]|nr:hypothetical protein [Micromonosporaceae bacterium]
KPPKWDPAERAAHEAEVRRRRDIEAARRHAKTIVTTVRAEVLTVLAGVDYGERGLVTQQMITELREVIDLLASRLDSRTGASL